MKINLSEIRIDGGTQSRVEINQQVVEDYAEAIKAGIKFPEVLLYFDGTAYWLVDGFHRYHAHRYAKKLSIDAIGVNGTQREAILRAVGTNHDHGLRRSNEDKRKAVGVLLADAEWSTWSDNAISKQCAVSHTFVAELRRSLATVASEKPTETRSVTTKHGTKTSMKTGNIGKKKPRSGAQKISAPAPEPIDGMPDAGEVMDEMEATIRAQQVKIDALSKSDQGKELAKQIDMRKDAERELGVKMDQVAARDRDLKSWSNWFQKLAKLTGLEKRSDVLLWIQDRADKATPAANGAAHPRAHA